jgi:hypothetical protein
MTDRELDRLACRIMPIALTAILAFLAMACAVATSGCCGSNQHWDFWKAKCVADPVGGTAATGPAATASAASASIASAVAKIETDRQAVVPDVDTLKCHVTEFPPDVVTAVQNLDRFVVNVLPQDLLGVGKAAAPVATLPQAILTAAATDTAAAYAAGKAEGGKEADETWHTIMRIVFACVAVAGLIGIVVNLSRALKGISDPVAIPGILFQSIGMTGIWFAMTCVGTAAAVEFNRILMVGSTILIVACCIVGLIVIAGAVLFILGHVKFSSHVASLTYNAGPATAMTPWQRLVNWWDNTPKVTP